MHGTRPPCASEVSNPLVDPHDRDLLPTGVYDITVNAASCNMNDVFERRARVFVGRREFDESGIRRSPAHINVPLPIPLGDDGVSHSTPRQELDLALPKKSQTTVDGRTCPRGVIRPSHSAPSTSRSRSPSAPVLRAMHPTALRARRRSRSRRPPPNSSNADATRADYDLRTPIAFERSISRTPCARSRATGTVTPSTLFSSESPVPTKSVVSLPSRSSCLMCSAFTSQLR